MVGWTNPFEPRKKTNLLSVTQFEKQWNHDLAICLSVPRVKYSHTLLKCHTSRTNETEKDPVLGFLIMVSKDDVKLDQQKFNSDVFWMVQPQHIDFGIGAFNQICKWYMISDSRDAKKKQKITPWVPILGWPAIRLGIWCCGTFRKAVVCWTNYLSFRLPKKAFQKTCVFPKKKLRAKPFKTIH